MMPTRLISKVDRLIKEILLRNSFLVYKKNSVILVHVGKCGGSSIRSGIENAVKNRPDHVIHIKKPPVRRDLNYVLVLRNPIDRIQSAFNWRYKIVVEDMIQKNRFKGEYDILKKYGSLENFANLLYFKDGNLNRMVARDFLRIHHIKENISFYLEDLLKNISSKQILGTVFTEDIEKNIEDLFGYKNTFHKKNNDVKRKKNELSQHALINLRKFFSKDYLLIHSLFLMNKIDVSTYNKVLSFELKFSIADESEQK